MKRVVILGRGASGKSTLARRLGEITGLPVVELDKVFWRPGLAATSREEWVAAQGLLIAKDRWIVDGDLGNFGVVETRLRGGHSHLPGLLIFVLRPSRNSTVARAHRLLVVGLGLPLAKPSGSPESDRRLCTERRTPRIS